MQTPDMLMETLRQRLCDVTLMEMSSPVRAALADMLALIEAHQNAANIDIQRPVFDSLIQLAGPSVAPELLRQLNNDLGAVERSLKAALAEKDLPTLRQQTHVLVGLAGSVGAQGLLQSARALNARAHQPQCPDLMAEGTQILAGTARLRSFVAQELARLGATLAATATNTKGTARS